MRESIQTLGVTIFPTLALSEVKWSPQSPCVSLGSSNGNFSRRNAGFLSRTHQAHRTFTPHSIRSHSTHLAESARVAPADIGEYIGNVFSMIDSLNE